MKKQLVVAGVMALALSMPLVGCAGGQSASDGATSGGAASGGAAEQTGDFDPVEAYWGEWRGTVEISGESIYGTTSGSERMLDITLAQDGTCTVEPVEAHADLLSDSGTWEGTETEVVLHLSDRDITLTVVSKMALEGAAADFDIADFETIDFTFYG